jgi:transcription elongation factor Elf1
MNNEDEALKKKHAEEALDRKAKATIQANNYNCSVKMAKFQLKKNSSIKEITCKNCGKVFKTNSNSDLCFNCQKK